MFLPGPASASRYARGSLQAAADRIGEGPLQKALDLRYKIETQSAMGRGHGSASLTQYR